MKHTDTRPLAVHPTAASFQPASHWGEQYGNYRYRRDSFDVRFQSRKRATAIHCRRYRTIWRDETCHAQNKTPWQPRAKRLSLNSVESIWIMSFLDFLRQAEVIASYCLRRRLFRGFRHRLERAIRASAGCRDRAPRLSGIAIEFSPSSM